MVSTKRARIIDADDVVEMGKLSDRIPPDPPTHVIAWQLEITASGGEVNVSYPKVWEFDLNGDKIEKYLEEYARDPDKARGKAPKEDKPDKGKTNLSIRNKEYCYIVFVLANKNVQFSESPQEAFKVEKDNDKFYMEPLCAWLDGTNFKIGRKAGPKSRVACFIADSERDQQASTQEFFTSFNIYLDLRLKRSDDPRIERLLPIVIDPDVGHPGGNHFP